MKRKFIPVFLILSAFFLFACGLTDRFLGIGEQLISTLEEEAAPTEPTEAEPQEPQATSTPEEFMEETQEPTTQSQADTDSACYHPFFPVVDGASWTYESTDSSGYTIQIEETGEDTFTMTQIMADEDAEFTVDWFCSDNGLLRGTFGQFDILNQVISEEETPEMTFDTIEWEGETLPAPELMETGYTWTSNYTLNAEVSLEGFSQMMDVKVSIDHEIGAIEEVTIPAGTFPEAYRVDSTGRIELFMKMDESSNPLNDFEFNFSTWYVEDVGMVQSGSEFLGYSSTVELAEFSMPE
ncbi:MAG: hypothetical protein ACOCYU_03800 [Brevefilum sp.]